MINHFKDRSNAEAHLGPFQASAVELFSKIFNTKLIS